ncbi:MAG TPA: hypothetical protein VMF69_16010 [Gemmataceae bacterium]|nr:hypothetical protein [Gemmataceae bacterium]
MENALDEYQLEAICREHPIAVAMFVPFAIARLHRESSPTEARVRVRMRNIGGQPEEERALRLFWSVESMAKQPLAVQEHVVTEWAALAMACVVLAKYTPLRLRAVALQGDRFDYWVTDGRGDYGLEISGTLEEDIEGRHRDKVRQLLANPYRNDGYAVTVRFAVPEVLFSFHRFEEQAR